MAIRDNPKFDFDPTICADVRPAEECGTERSEAYTPWEELGVPTIAGVTFLDLVDVYCESEFCGVVDGPILQYRDTNHLTTTWILVRGEPYLSEAISEVLGR